MLKNAEIRVYLIVSKNINTKIQVNYYFPYKLFPAQPTMSRTVMFLNFEFECLSMSLIWSESFQVNFLLRLISLKLTVKLFPNVTVVLKLRLI